MRFTEHELTVAVEAAARTVAGARARRRGGAEAVWESMGKVERYHALEAVGSQVLPALIALPDVDVAAGTRPTFTDAQVLRAVEETIEAGGAPVGRLRRKVNLAARAALVKVALAALPPRRDPDAVLPDQ